jgi:cbb3-type cytochrome oxidase subunit 3
MAKKIDKQIWLPLVLFVYFTGMAVYFIPRNNEMTDTMKIVTIVVGYLIVAALYFALKKKKKLQNEREEDMKNSDTEQTNINNN